MQVYELITPSDPITFKAISDKVATWVSIYLGKGKAGCISKDGRDLNTLMLFETNIEEVIKENLGCSFKDFYERNMVAIADALDSFAYGNFSGREEFDFTCEALKDNDEKLQEFKSIHEDKNRSSMSKWVAFAWELGKEIRTKAKIKKRLK